MSRKIPLPIVGTMALGLTPLTGCGDDPLVGSWTITKVEEREMPYIYSDGYGDYTYGGSMKIFEDLFGYLRFDMSYAVDVTIPYGEGTLSYLVDRGYSYVARLSASANGEDSYGISVGDDSSLDCSLTLPQLKCVDVEDRSSTIEMRKIADE